ncbi:MAG: PDZ domain-containing protein [Alphaproteobacteria bacterium]|nr:PDZ domain-containing protein [Alphaproteobacteria bacterium]
MKLKHLFLCLTMAIMPCSVFSSDLFFEDRPIQDGIDVFKVSDVFADIYEKLDSVHWAGKNIDVAIESLESLNPNAHIAATGERAVLVWGDELIANYPYPKEKDWKAYGQITTALLLKMRERDARLQSLQNAGLYEVVVNALLKGIDQNGYYVYSRDAINDWDTKILTSIGFDGGRDFRGNLRITGVFKDSPADMAGLREGDIVSEINGQRVENMSDGDISAILTGYNSGTSKLKVLTPFGNRYVTLRKATIVLADADIIYRAKNETTDGLLEIVIHKITDGAVNIVNEALAKHSDIGGIILDLRTATGDDEKAAAKIAGLFIGQKPMMIVSETAVDELQVVPGGDAVTDVPVVVLISDNTRGTSEALASALYENKRGLLVGTPTSGRARIASRIDLNNGGMLELLNKSIKSGNGNDIDGRGVFPLICLSNIRSSSEQEAFFLNVMNDNFNAHDYNKDKNVSLSSLRKACPVISSGVDEDNLATSVSVKILTNKKIYNDLMDL